MSQTDPLWGLPDPDTNAGFYENTSVKRFFAWIIDTIIILLLSVIVLPFTAFIGLFFFPAFLLMIGLAYRIVTIANSSATPGMLMMGIEFRNRFGERFDLPLATLHTLLFTACFWMFFFGQLVSIILMLTSARGQGLPDMLLGTAAINRARLL